MKTVKYTVKIHIDKDINSVSKIFVDYQKMPEWQVGLTKINHVSGNPSANDSVTHLHYSFNTQTMVMKETIINNQLPHLYITTYEVEDTWNKCVNHFIEDDQTTLWVMTSEFQFNQTQENPKQAFVDKTTKSMQVFKAFVENID
jgi:hypothetical protein